MNQVDTPPSGESPTPALKTPEAPQTRSKWLLDPGLSRDVLKLALPVVLAMLTQTAINIMDTVMVGWLDPSYSIAGQSALGYSLPLLWLVGGFLSAISVGTLAITARRLGGRGRSTRPTA
jgi:Na+-driven multidrug efflux pump